MTKMKQPSTDAVVLRTFRSGDEASFLRLNEAWIQQDFTLEEEDRAILADPQRQILDPGGAICMAEMNGEAVGCCALVVMGPGELELAKMTVAESARGLGIGRRLLEFAIAEARRMRAHRLCLESNTRAQAAVRLYERMGFRHLPEPLHPSKYERANVFMELQLEHL
ncbi:MAG TPA: GNAT family N-acetyltransferase [Acidobacteriaceae bacterium]|jgi:ribosomal protein S18 acetylase RimI-like enzyme|nr:GNAT family N-acetyltransferase [Acidobacteriaceae bacterium]